MVEEVKAILVESLGLGMRAESLSESTPLLGNLPEFDSMAVVSVITAIEEHFGVTIEDDEISAEAFESVKTLADFVERKLEA